MKRKIGRLCMVLGAVLILSAAGLLGYNRWDAARAEKASQEVLGELEQTMQKTITEHRQENETAAPQPVLDPAQEMTTVEVEGHDYIGVLSIPAAGLELPVMAQWSYAGLKVAPGRYSGTTYADDLVLCGHQLCKAFQSHQVAGDRQPGLLYGCGRSALELRGGERGDFAPHPDRGDDHRHRDRQLGSDPVHLHLRRQRPVCGALCADGLPRPGDGCGRVMPSFAGRDDLECPPRVLWA